MFHYIHGYNTLYWKGLIKNGLIDHTSGVKITQGIFNKKSDCFNEIAAENGELYNIIVDEKRPFYVDRLQGGIFYFDYKFDKSLIGKYKDILGDKFLGFQMHEWISNLIGDWKRLEQAKCLNKNAEEITKIMLSTYGYEVPYLESHSAAEFSNMEKPKNLTQITQQSYELFKKRQFECCDMLLPSDSYCMAPKIEIQSGAKHLMPEIGGQIADTRIQLAYTRGMAKSHNVDWGAYYEPWGGEPFGVCNYKIDNKNEWNMSNGETAYSYYGENGGSSRSLQKRIHMYAFLSGAKFISEEWGVANTFYDWNDFDLSPYGMVKKEFLAFVKQIPNSVPYTPIALVLPSDMDIFDLNYENHTQEYAGMPVSRNEAEKYKKIWENLRIIFGNADNNRGAESNIMRNSKYPDVFDIVHNDIVSLSKYDYVIDLTSGNGELNQSKKFDSIKDLDRILDNLLPCFVKGNVHWLINKSENENIITIFNNNGVGRTVLNGDVINHKEDSIITLTVKGEQLLNCIYGNVEIEKNGTVYEMNIPAGECVVFSICNS